MVCKICPNCGKLFNDLKLQGRIYCSYSCNQKAYRKRQMSLKFINFKSQDKLLNIRGFKDV